MNSVRTCVGCRRRALKEDLLRLVFAGGSLLVDVNRVLPSRGAWLHLDPECLALAKRSRAFKRALRLEFDPDTGELDKYISNRGITAMDKK